AALRVALRGGLRMPRENGEQLEVRLRVVARELGVGSGVDALRDKLGRATAHGLEVARARFEEALASGALRPAVDLACARAGHAEVQRDAPADRAIRRGEDLLLDALEGARDRDMHRPLAPELHLQHIRSRNIPLRLLGPSRVPEDDARRI